MVVAVVMLAIVAMVPPSVPTAAVLATVRLVMMVAVVATSASSIATSPVVGRASMLRKVLELRPREAARGSDPRHLAQVAHHRRKVAVVEEVDRHEEQLLGDAERLAARPRVCGDVTHLWEAQHGARRRRDGAWRDSVDQLA